MEKRRITVALIVGTIGIVALGQCGGEKGPTAFDQGKRRWDQAGDFVGGSIDNLIDYAGALFNLPKIINFEEQRLWRDGE